MHCEIVCPTKKTFFFSHEKECSEKWKRRELYKVVTNENGLDSFWLKSSGKMDARIMIFLFQACMHAWTHSRYLHTHTISTQYCHQNKLYLFLSSEKLCLLPVKTANPTKIRSTISWRKVHIPARRGKRFFVVSCLHTIFAQVIFTENGNLVGAPSKPTEIISVSWKGKVMRDLFHEDVPRVRWSPPVIFIFWRKKNLQKKKKRSEEELTCPIFFSYVSYYYNIF